MARPKKQIRESSFVTLRKKPVSKGRESLYLDIYKDGQRTYEFLRLYLLPGKDEDTRTKNDNTLASAKAIRNKRENEIIQGKGDIKKKSSKLLLVDYLIRYKEKKAKTGQSEERAKTVDALTKHIIRWGKEETPLCYIDKQWVLGFIDYLASAKSLTSEKPLSKSSANLYFSLFSEILSRAVIEEKITANPVAKVKDERKMIRRDEKKRSYLTIEELKTLIDTKCGNEDIKRAFLFSCFTGLRWSDIQNLKWSDISKEDGKYYLTIKMQKTKEDLKLKLNDNALKFLPNRKSTFVFANTSSRVVNAVLKTWVKHAKIEKHITFHSARHTFATIQITLDTPIYTVSKLLGHTQISTTQIYAEIVNKKKDEAMDKMSKIL